MITLHRLGHPEEPFELNPDLIVTVESTPDTVVTLATTAKVVVCESPEEVAAAVRAWRVEVLSEALRGRRAQREAGARGAREETGRLTAVPTPRSTASTPPLGIAREN
ncbi:MAG TPA: flagellar FlbD family protein [Solirubrobacteraceae bacterium]|jgi:flagellar protein FlbD|nr:flagellar FlbD family protein [Solirubrobacteraceae bacterium]